MRIGMSMAMTEMAEPYPVYYVDATGGNDANTGRSPAQAWKTITKVNGFNFAPGDSCLFKTGETWSGITLVPKTSGQSGNPITFASYGSGAQPILQAGAAGATRQAVYLQTSYLTFRNIHMKYGYTGTLEGNGSVCHDILIDSCTVEGDVTVRANGLSFYGTSLPYNITIHNCTVFNCKVQAAGGGGITGGFQSNLTIANCTIHHCGTSSSADHGIYVTCHNGLVCHDNISYSNTAMGIKLDGVTNGLVYNNQFYSNGQAGIMFTGANSNLLVYNNLIYSNAQAGCLFNVSTGSAKLFHNTFYNNGGTAIYYFSGSTGSFVENNAIYEANGYTVFQVATAATLTNNTINNNCVYSGVTGTPYYVGGTGYSLAAWKALSGTPEVNGVNADPKFVTNGSDYHLQPSSPCRGAGAIGLGITADYAGVTRGNPPSIGMYEYV